MKNSGGPPSRNDVWKLSGSLNLTAPAILANIASSPAVRVALKGMRPRYENAASMPSIGVVTYRIVSCTEAGWGITKIVASMTLRVTRSKSRWLPLHLARVLGLGDHGLDQREPVLPGRRGRASWAAMAAGRP